MFDPTPSTLGLDVPAPDAPRSATTRRPRGQRVRVVRVEPARARHGPGRRSGRSPSHDAVARRRVRVRATGSRPARTCRSTRRAARRSTPGTFGVAARERHRARRPARCTARCGSCDDAQARTSALGSSLTLPTATDSQFAGTELPTGPRCSACASAALGKQLALHVNLGRRAAQERAFANIEQGSGLSWGVGASFRALDAHVHRRARSSAMLIPGGYHAAPPADGRWAPPRRSRRVEALGGARFQSRARSASGLAAGRGLTSGIGTPDLRGVFTFAFTPSATPLPPLASDRPTSAPADPTTGTDTRLRQASSTRADKCPNEPEDKDGFQDDDGCPDLDNDKRRRPRRRRTSARTTPRTRTASRTTTAARSRQRQGRHPRRRGQVPDRARDDQRHRRRRRLPRSRRRARDLSPDRLELLEAVDVQRAQGREGAAPTSSASSRRRCAPARISRLRITVHVQPSKEPREGSGALRQARRRRCRLADQLGHRARRASRSAASAARSRWSRRRRRARRRSTIASS